MTTLKTFALLASATLFPVLAAPAATPVAASPAVMIAGQPVTSLAPIIKRAGPAVVNIAARGTQQMPNNPFYDDPFFRRFFGAPPQRREREVASQGSGVIVDAAKGFIVTNHHVVDGASEVTGWPAIITAGEAETGVTGGRAAGAGAATAWKAPIRAADSERARERVGCMQGLKVEAGKGNPGRRDGGGAWRRGVRRRWGLGVPSLPPRPLC